MLFNEWIKTREGTESEIRIARDAWDTAQATERINFYRHANWASLNGMFSPKTLREIADKIEQGYGPGLH